MRSGLLKTIESITGTKSGPAETVQAAMDAIKQTFQEFYWVGVYLLLDDELILGPYSGPATEHTRIPVGRGVCGTAVSKNKNQIVDDVRALQNYLACNLSTRSEIVVLVRDPDSEMTIGQIDIDCTEVGRFGVDDEALLESIGRMIAPSMRALVAAVRTPDCTTEIVQASRRSQSGDDPSRR